MTPSAFLLLALMCVLALGDWIAVMRGNRRLEYLCKPLTMAGLVAVAVAVEPVDDTMRMWFVVALMLSLAGDVFLMLPRDAFVFGLGAFLLAHLAYIGGFWTYIGAEVLDGGLDGSAVRRLGAGAGLALVALALAGLRIVAGARRRAPELLGPVAVYMVVIMGMLVAAVVAGRPAAVAGALLFVASDTLIGWTRFVRPDLLVADRGLPGRAPLAIMVTYHLGQAGLVLSLAPSGLWYLAGTAVVMALGLLALLEIL